MRKIDREALERCIEAMRDSKEPADREQIEDLLKTGGWQKAADQAAYHCQNRALRLKPWQDPPLVWFTLGIFLTLLTAEWTVRKLAGLP